MMIHRFLEKHPEKIARARKPEKVVELIERGREDIPTLAAKKMPIVDPALKILANKYADELLFEKHHFLMQAENLIGNLVEYYIDANLPNNWLFCPKQTIIATDFVRQNEDGSYYFLNVKNRFNSENSSSARERVFRGVDLWYRIKKDGSTNWDAFPESSVTLSEEAFIDYVKQHI